MLDEFPRPWRLGTMNPYPDDDEIDAILAANDEPVVYFPDEMETGEFIVHRVNVYDDLLEACEAFLAAWDSSGDGNDLAWAAGRARAAVRKAKEETADASGT